MKVKHLLPILLDIEQVRICNANGHFEWSGYAYSIPQEYYNDNIDTICSFPAEYLNSCTYIFIK
jgi:hypothetical protein